MRNKNLIQLTNSQLDRFARTIAYRLAKELVGDIEATDDGKVYNMTQKDAAEYLNVDTSVVRRMVRDKQIRGKLKGKRIYYCREDLEAFKSEE